MAGISDQTQQQAARLLAALEQNPGLLHLVLAGLHEAGHKTAGPWHRPTMDQRARIDFAGHKLAIVTKDKARTFPWRASLAKRVGTKGESIDSDRYEKGFQTEHQALLWCDQILIEHGYTLATDPGEV